MSEVENPPGPVAALAVTPPTTAPQPRSITTAEEFKQAMEAARGTTVVLDFISADCDACAEDKPELERLAGCPSTTVLTVDVDQLPEIADALKADGTPTMYLGKAEDFLVDLERGDAAAKAEKRIPRPKHIKEVAPGDRLLRRLKCARK